jgi:hypothetical protein
VSADLEQALAEARAERARLWEENQRLRAERREVEYYERLAAHMEGSVSWKLTAPLRTAKRVAGKVRRELEERRG